MEQLEIEKFNHSQAMPDLRQISAAPDGLAESYLESSRHGSEDFTYVNPAMGNTLPAPIDYGRNLRDYGSLDVAILEARGITGTPGGWEQRNVEGRKLSNEEAEDLTSAALNWLPNRIGDHGAVYSESDETSQDGLRISEYYQMWGEFKPEEIESEGVAVEIAGPTENQDTLAAMINPDFVSNLAYKEGDMGIAGDVDFVADARELPLADKSVGAVVVNALTGHTRMNSEYAPDSADTREKAISEAVRVVKDEGYIVWGNGSQRDFDDLKRYGMEPVFAEAVYRIKQEEATGLYKNPEFNVSAVFKKPLTT